MEHSIFQKQVCIDKKVGAAGKGHSDLLLTGKGASGPCDNVGPVTKLRVSSDPLAGPTSKIFFQQKISQGREATQENMPMLIS